MLRQRIITALVIGTLLIAVILWLPNALTVGVLGAILLLGAWEWSAFVGFERTPARSIYVGVLGLCMVGAWAISANIQGLFNLLGVTAVWWVFAFVWIVWFPRRVSAGAAAVAGLLVLVPAWIALARLHMILPQGPQLVLFLFLLVWAADVGAFIAGRKFGSIKLAPQVSPGKTWEGVLGGTAMAAIVAFVGVRWFGLPGVAFLALCAAVVLASIVGDLTESLFKRHAGLKDSSNLLPGHGGVLDRIDSVTAAAPLFLLGLHWIGALS